MRRKILKFVPAMMLAATMVAGPSVMPGSFQGVTGVSVAQAAGDVVKGKVLGVSNKAKTITIEAKGSPVMIKFNDDTKGMEHAAQGEAAIVKFKMMGEDKVAVEVQPKLAELPEGVTEIQPEELAQLVAMGPEKGNYALIDSRPEGRFHAGHIPGSISIPVEKLKKTGATYIPSDAKIKNKTLIFYCGGPTWGMSTSSAGLAKKMGYKNVKVMLKGAPGWKKAGHQVVASDKFVNTGNIVLVDLRDKDAVAKGHIKRAVNVPFADLADAEDDFPDVKAPIVLYGPNAEKAVKTVKKWGYKSVALVDGNLEGYVARGGALVTDPVADEIVWVRKLGKGEVAIDEFMKAASGNSGQLIVDVRTKDEIAGGMFNNAVSIPLDSLEKRMAELPKDKELLLHCTTGARAEMAWQSLSKAGYKAKFVVANVECAGGKCEIEE